MVVVDTVVVDIVVVDIVVVITVVVITMVVVDTMLAVEDKATAAGFFAAVAGAAPLMVVAGGAGAGASL